MKLKNILGYLVHVFTALGAVFGLLAIYAIHEQNYYQAFLYMGITIFIDSVDGTLARAVDIKHAAPNVDGALMDNIIDYLTYAVAPAFLLLTTDFLLPQWKLLSVAAIVVSSAYQFSQTNAKPADHFFVGFPDYWNFVVFYFFFWNFSQAMNTAIILILAILVFIPVKYIYPSRIENLSTKKWVKTVFTGATILFGIVTMIMMIYFPEASPVAMYYTLFYIALYTGFSLYRTFRPVKIKTKNEK